MLNKPHVKPEDASGDVPKSFKSRVHFDHFNIERGKEVVDRELPKGKRTNFDYLKNELY